MRAIETLQPSDLVWSRDETTGQTELKSIVQTFERYAATLALTFSNGETVETTREHPFYVESEGFVKAGELGIGTSIVTRAGPARDGGARRALPDLHRYARGASGSACFGFVGRGASGLQL